MWLGIAKRGILAVVVIRMLPVAPFTVVNIVAGASQISLRDFLVGTLLGMAPGICATVLFVDGVTDAVRSPDFGNLTFLAIVACQVALLVRQQFGPRPAAR